MLHHQKLAHEAVFFHTLGLILLALTNLTESHKITVGNVKIGLNTSLIQGLYTYRIAVWEASQAWLGMGGHGGSV